jgi:hypothetical protein
MTVESLPRVVYENRALDSLADSEVDGPGDPRRERHGHDFAALAGRRQRPGTTFQAERVDVGAKCFGDA